jgi:hypothetical protein
VPDLISETLMKVVCSLCGEDVEPGARTTMQKVTGWEKKRRQGGANQIILRELLPEFAHSSCVEERKLGIHHNQALLFR